jgi:LysM repeat protein
MSAVRIWVCAAAVGLVGCGADDADPPGSLPPIVTVATTATTTTPPGMVQQQFYVIQEGDTLGRIARNFAVTEQALMELNGIPDANFIEIGQTIEIPPPTTTTIGGVPTSGTPGSS